MTSRCAGARLESARVGRRRTRATLRDGTLWAAGGEDQGRGADRKQLADALVADPTLVNDYGRLTKMAEGRLDLVGKAIQNETARRSMPNEAGVPPATRYTTEAGAAVGTADQAARDAKAEQDRAIAAANLEAANARDGCCGSAEAGRVLADQFRTSQGDLGKEGPGIGSQDSTRRGRRRSSPGLSSARRRCAEATPGSARGAGRVQGFLQSGELPRNDAYAIASGDYSALATPLDQPTPAPTVAPPTPTALATPVPEGLPLRSATGCSRRRWPRSSAEAVRPTPMATPTRSVSRVRP